MLRAPFRVSALSYCKDFLKIAWKDGAESTFPNIWLRGSVRDPKFFGANYMYNQKSYTDFVTTESPIVHAENPSGGEDILVEWADHRSSFNASWLRAQDSKNNERLSKKPELTLWDGNFKFPAYNYSERIKTLGSWLSDLTQYGVAIFQGVPPNEEGLQGILHCVGQEAQRNHPTNTLVIKADKNKETNVDTNIYTSEPHPVHVDTSYYETMVRLSCLVSTHYFAPKQDTMNFFVDNLKVIEDIRQEEPEAFELLRTVPVRIARRRLTVQENCDPAELYIYHYETVVKRSLISYDDKEKHLMLYFSNGQAGIDFSSFKDHRTMKRYYEAYKLLESKLSNPDNHVQIIMKEGTGVIFNNYRVGHGRGPIHASTNRGVILGFIGEEMWNTRWRVLLGERSGLEDRWLFGCSNKELEILANRKES